MRLEDNFFKLPIRVSFAGLFGTTMEMARLGWELSLMEGFDLSRYGKIFRFCGYNKKLDLRCFSAGMFIDERINFKEYVACAEFPVLIEHTAREIRIPSNSSMNLHTQRWDGAISLDRSVFENTMQPIGLSGNFTVPTYLIDKLAKFTSIDDGTDIYIQKDKIWTIEEHLNEIRRIQEPLQKEIRRKIVNEQERQNLEMVSKTKIYMVS